MSTRRVLVVDDDALIRETLAAALRDEGYAVRVAAEGQAALATLREWRPDLIVLDLMMPGMDGWAFRAAQRSLEAVARVPVIVLSAAHNLQGAAENLAAAAIFSKPFDLGTLLDAVGRLVGSSCRFQPK